jgi:chlorobactene glucosyltransferase
LSFQNLITLLYVVAWATWILWLVGAGLTWRGMRRAREILPRADETLKQTDAPFASVLVPARNEAHRVLEAAVRSMLAQDYPSFEIVAVNDRSTDTTGEILRALEKTDAPLRVIEGAPPPDGWLGKPFALQQALNEARGEWILATDADMIFNPAALRSALAEARARSCDALTLIPQVVCLSFWERVFMPVFGWFMLLAAPLERVNDPRRRESLGVGGFFLTKREALERIGGYASVRAEVVEDLRLAELLKRSGAALRVDFAPQLIRTRMQTNLHEIWEGFSKNLFAGAQFSVWRTIAGCLSVTLFAVAPVFAALACALLSLSGANRETARFVLPCLLVWLTQVATFAFVNKRWHVPARYAFAVPLGHALFVAILLNSMLRIMTGAGVVWKGRRLYSAKEGKS